MDARVADPQDSARHQVLAPERQTLPLVLASPHSGRDYPGDLLNASRLDPLSLRRSEDSFVDEIFLAAPRLGAPLIRALFPRAYIDVNREPFELDPAMFADELPSYVNVCSPRVAAGLGTIARVVGSGAPIYRHQLTFDEALGRIRHCYWPYHRSLRSLVEQTRQRFGFCILVDCHSMPSGGAGGAGGTDGVGGGEAKSLGRIEFVIGDCHGASCAPAVTRRLLDALGRLNYAAARNSPYSGGYVTRNYGRPADGIHAVQIEINRRLYMDERRIERRPNLHRLQSDMEAVTAALGALRPEELA